MAFGLGILLKLLGLGKTLLGFVWDAIKGICKFAVEKPFQFLTIALAATLIFTGWWGYNTRTDLLSTQKIVEEKTKYIQSQQVVLTQYVTALDKEKKNHVADIKASNVAVSSLKKTADEALANAKKEAQKVAVKQQQYQTLAQKYSVANSSAGTAEDRIKREEQTNDQFIEDWNKAKK